MGQLSRDCLHLAVGVIFTLLGSGLDSGQAQSGVESALVGEWDTQQESKHPCKTLSFSIQRLTEPGPLSEDLAASENRDCTYKITLNYFGRAFEQGGQTLVSLNPTPKDHHVKAKIPDRRDYNLDRLTLWLSRDRCELIGFRNDGGMPTLLRLRKRECPARPSSMR